MTRSGEGSATARLFFILLVLTNPGSGVKRRGKVVTGRCVNDPPNSTHVCWSLTNPLASPGEDSGTCYGDSGGPLFVDFGSGPTVTAVTSLVTTECEPPSTFRDTDVFVYRSWIQAQGGTDLQNATCGTLSQIGAGSSVVTTTGQMVAAVNRALRGCPLT